MRYESRTGAVLFANDLERVARFYAGVLGLSEVHRDEDHILLESPGFQMVVHRIVAAGSAPAQVTAPPERRRTAAYKPVFFVPSLSRVREVAGTYGGVIEPAEKEWSFDGVTVCDGLDPEGNVIQFREHAG